MPANVYVIGLAELTDDIGEMARIIKESPELITEQLALSMSKFVHVRSGYLKGTIYHKSREAGATAAYAGHEADRGGEHDFAQLAIDDFDMKKLADRIVEPF